MGVFLKREIVRDNINLLATDDRRLDFVVTFVFDTDKMVYTVSSNDDRLCLSHGSGFRRSIKSAGAPSTNVVGARIIIIRRSRNRLGTRLGRVYVSALGNINTS